MMITMPRIFTFTILAALLLTFVGQAQAKVRSFNGFSIDVPDGWSVKDDKENYTVIFMSPDESSILTIAFFENEGMSAEEHGKYFVEEWKGKDLRKLNDTTYQFLFKGDNGEAGRALVSVDKKDVLFITAIGENAVMDGMIHSLKSR